MSNGEQDDDDVPPEERGVDKGFECKLVAEQRDDPEFRRLIEEEANAQVSSTIEKYGARIQVFKQQLEAADQDEVEQRIKTIEQT